jgi:2-polyprenyl-3-methyl-5-hydroxy-6-metoxy-1,4-benzoquinol methylase
MFDRKSHWENIYTIKDSTEVSWYQQHPATSLELIISTGIAKEAQIIDVGGGASTLVDALLAQGFQCITVLDIASAALEKSKARLGERANGVGWMEAEITQVTLPRHHYDLWHDRAVFHFLTDARDRQSYIKSVGTSLKPSGHLIIATFATDGPKKCSGLDTVRYSSGDLLDEFGNDFRLVESVDEAHRTPFGTEQNFIYCHLQNRKSHP